MFTVFAACAITTLMGFFAWKNHKEGWVKPRKPMIENLRRVAWKPHPDLSAVPELSSTSLSLARTMGT